MSDSGLWYVYIIETDNHRLYTGITKDVARRFSEHQDVFAGNSGAKGAKYFRTAKPVRIVFQEACDNRSEATKKEIQIKSLSRAQKLKLINQHSG
ncbi:GIY-YIG nuclease family protein [Teredinibacter sp. KSP-S5-2]|uniref:GIY-YIG nuclease family protein n=1 Tax=Teredinibacter sp. KSP-S5-2 TaxID=3034506 RepID=UPI0029352A42|nr:GIY-YIG nuclease family protein [Teredinibacter sp. KSP-S5-2]WNO08938.1 GIY-YIG nuclease family protein [Teredinibacter sp. KSP-S5-2]